MTYYLDVEAVTEDHVRQATKLLRNIYGQRLLFRTVRQRDPPRRLYLRILPRNCACTPLRGSPRRAHFSVCVRHAIAVYCVVEGCRVFADYVSKHNGYVPRWVVAAFWWLSYAVDGSLSVHDLTAAIERWYGGL